MALKDWKKINDDFYEFHYRKETSSAYFGNEKIYCMKMRSNGVIVFAVVYGDVLYPSNKEFKSKSAAIKFAKDYMEKH